MNRIILKFLFIFFLFGCSSFEKGEYGYDLEFLNKNLESTIELVKGDFRLVTAPQYQGRVMTSSSRGLKGYSNGWINHDLISSAKVMEHFNPFGGEERLWLGPEGGQFSLFFSKDSSFSSKNWYVPKELDSEAFDVENHDSSTVTFSKRFELTNYSGNTFDLKVTRKITLFSEDEIKNHLSSGIPESIHVVGYQSDNILKNMGNNPWTKETGSLSIWMLSMLNASPGVTVILPYKKGNFGRIVKDDYFVKVPENRLQISENAVFFLADGTFRSKIGISHCRTIPRIGSYDAVNKKLTIVEFSFSESDTAYVNNSLEIQKDPFSGDVINVYNDGPKDLNPGMGRYYELETSSPAAFLRPGNEISFIQRTFHFEGDEEGLDKLSRLLLNVSLDETKSVFGEKKNSK